MKLCPICNARCFDDMETCFGCMYQFVATPTKEVEPYMAIQQVQQSEIQKIERRNQPRHAAPIKADMHSAQSMDSGAVIQAKYQLTISLEPI